MNRETLVLGLFLASGCAPDSARDSVSVEDSTTLDSNANVDVDAFVPLSEQDCIVNDKVDYTSQQLTYFEWACESSGVKLIEHQDGDKRHYPLTWPDGTNKLKVFVLESASAEFKQSVLSVLEEHMALINIMEDFLQKDSAFNFNLQIGVLPGDCTDYNEDISLLPINSILVCDLNNWEDLHPDLHGNTASAFNFNPDQPDRLALKRALITLDPNLSDAQFLSTLSHEFCHAQGLAHPRMDTRDYSQCNLYGDAHADRLSSVTLACEGPAMAVTHFGYPSGFQGI